MRAVPPNVLPPNVPGTSLLRADGSVLQTPGGLTCRALRWGSLPGDAEAPRVACLRASESSPTPQIGRRLGSDR